jgi:hypothetical protein
MSASVKRPIPYELVRVARPLVWRRRPVPPLTMAPTDCSRLGKYFWFDTMIVADCPSVEKKPSKPHSPLTSDCRSGVTAAGTPLISL